jgi:hypothetical protein
MKSKASSKREKTPSKKKKKPERKEGSSLQTPSTLKRF